MVLQLPAFLGYKRKRNHREDEGEIIKKKGEKLRVFDHQKSLDKNGYERLIRSGKKEVKGKAFESKSKSRSTKGLKA